MVQLGPALQGGTDASVVRGPRERLMGHAGIRQDLTGLIGDQHATGVGDRALEHRLQRLQAHRDAQDADDLAVGRAGGMDRDAEAEAGGLGGILVDVTRGEVWAVGPPRALVPVPEAQVLADGGRVVRAVVDDDAALVADPRRDHARDGPRYLPERVSERSAGT